ncbi:hypothetical protein SmJEL517_g04624 [Synchytrium microbalum]|uniref:Uncharacterized protein n=1 Tax=Synchytrium microbalum TaxID=1806994 RepID=A0A507BT57_9FUNG|nr:uncharacterized protein SmJEL517_g04624 [Synchytrium microbalum]TPX32217.1 hypothetical protein SmJEL517_g04624 [Synchytrium microbalum]
MLAFTSSQPRSVDIGSIWQRPKTVLDLSTQTTPRSFTHDETQTNSNLHSSTQTDLQPNQPQNIRLDVHQQQKLVAFLDKAERDVSSQLLRNLQSRAFDGFEVKWEDDVDTNSKLYELCDPHMDEDSEVTGLSWSHSGTTLAASYGRRDHAAWCTHQGRISTWTLSSRRVVTDKPTFSAQVSTCVMCIAYHPEQPTIIAGGTFHGQVIIWDTNKTENPVIGTSGDGELAHHESVSYVAWIPSARSNTYDLLTASTEGKILIYSFSNDLAFPVAGSRIMLANVARVEKSLSKVKANLPVGITALALQQTVGNAVDTVIVGTETGFVLKCGAAGTRISDKNEDAPLSNPIIFGFNSHLGPVNSISCSPFHRNLFLTCGNDREVRLYTALQPNPILTFEPSSMDLSCAAWSNTRPAVYAVGSADGHTYFYDLSKSTTTPTSTLQLTQLDKKPKTRITFLAFSNKPSDMFASGDASGHVHVWQLSSNLSREAMGEMWTLDLLSSQ